MPLKLTVVFTTIFTLLVANPRFAPVKEDSGSLLSLNDGIELVCSDVFCLLRSGVSKPDYEVFKKAFTGFLNLKAENNIEKNILTIIDFSISSKFDRMWIIDMNRMEIVHQGLVAHGRNSGEEYATSFSNSPASHMSSLGFYLTGGTYYGKHGKSLILDGIEPGINDNARSREIVMHGADYVSNDFIKRYGRLGRSFGCPSIALADHEKIIELLAGKSCIYIYYPDDKYQRSTRLFTTNSILEGMHKLLSESPGINAISFQSFAKYLIPGGY